MAYVKGLRGFAKYPITFQTSEATCGVVIKQGDNITQDLVSFQTSAGVSLGGITSAGKITLSTIGATTLTATNMSATTFSGTSLKATTVTATNISAASISATTATATTLQGTTICGDTAASAVNLACTFAGGSSASTSRAPGTIQVCADAFLKMTINAKTYYVPAFASAGAFTAAA